MAWTTKLFETFGWNRDSLALFWAKWCAFVLALAVVAGGCAHASPTLTPDAAVAFNADRVVHVLSVVQDSAISLNANGFLNDADTSLVIKAVTGAVKTIQTVPQGAYATVNAALSNLQASLRSTT